MDINQTSGEFAPEKTGAWLRKESLKVTESLVIAEQKASYQPIIFKQILMLHNRIVSVGYVITRDGTVNPLGSKLAQNKYNTGQD